jgi:hypothetical protein
MGRYFGQKIRLKIAKKRKKSSRVVEFIAVGQKIRLVLVFSKIVIFHLTRDWWLFPDCCDFFENISVGYSPTHSAHLSQFSGKSDDLGFSTSILHYG